LEDGVNTVKTLKFEKSAWPPSSYSGTALASERKRQVRHKIPLVKGGGCMAVRFKFDSYIYAQLHILNLFKAHWKHFFLTSENNLVMANFYYNFIN